MAFNLTTELKIPGLKKDLGLVNQNLKQIISDQQVFYKSLKDILSASNKRLRPSLVIICSKLSGSKTDQNLINLATAIELIHISSLIHDDVIDDAETRWNLPTLSKSHGTSQAIVIGDYLLGVGCAMASDTNHQAAKHTTEAIAQLCSGQALELKDKHNIHRSRTNYFKSVAGKSAGMFSLSCVLGGLSAGMNPSDLNSLHNYGYNFGIAFQMIDDLMNIISSKKLYGKPVGNDIADGVFTLPVIIGLENFPDLLSLSKPQIIEKLIECGALEKTIKSINKYNKNAVSVLQHFEGQTADKLKALPEIYLKWNLHNMVVPKYKKTILEMQKM